MTDLIRRFRGLGVALVVLALSAGAVFAAAPQFSPTSDNEQGVEQPDGADATDDAATEVDEDADADESGDEADTETDGAETEDADTETEDADTETEDATG